MSTTSYHFESFDGFSPFSDVGPYRAADYWQLPEGEPVELLRGRLILSPSRSVLHQMVVGELALRLLQISRQFGGFGIMGPLDCIFSDDTIVQPDLLYVAKRRRSILADRVHGVPDLMIEVVERETRRRDRVEKLDVYATYAVPEYWIIDPESQHIDFLLNVNGRFALQTPVGDRYESPRLPEIEVDIASFWREVDAQMTTD